jgi:hypothetical protein
MKNHPTNVILISCIFILIMTILIWIMPNDKGLTAQQFFKEILPTVSIVKLLEVFKTKKL